MTPAPRAPTLSAALLQGAVDVAAEHGLARAELLARLGVESDADLEFDRRLPQTRVNDFWAHVVRRLRQPGLPLLTAGRLRTEQLHVLGFALLTSPTAREATRRVIRFGNLLTDGERWSLQEQGDEATLLLDSDAPLELGQRVGHEAALASFFITSRQVMQADYGPLRASFRHPAPAGSARVHEEFFGCQVRFGAERNALVLPRHLLETVPRLANPVMADFFDGEMQKRLGRLPASGQETLLERVAGAVSAQLTSGEPSMRTVGQKLGMSERSLRRSLAGEGTGFRELVDRLRREQAGRLLGDGQISLSEIGFLLGFSEASAFSRAFKRWFGVPPGEYRRAP